jgi:hypothetical protein
MFSKTDSIALPEDGMYEQKYKCMHAYMYRRKKNASTFVTVMYV